MALTPEAEKALANQFAFGLESLHQELHRFRVEFRRGGKVQETFDVTDASRELVEMKHRSMCAPGQSMLVTRIEQACEAPELVEPVHAFRLLGAL